MIAKSSDQILSPDHCTPAQLDAFAEIVVRAGQVQAAGIGERMHRAHRLAFHYQDGGLVGVAAIKRPGDGYRAKVFRKAKSPDAAAAFPAELGWVFTDAAYRGLGIAQRLLAELLAKAPPDRLFATTRVDNTAMQRLLETLGFARSGVPFRGADTSHSLELWVQLLPSRSSRPLSTSR